MVTINVILNREKTSLMLQVLQEVPGVTSVEETTEGYKVTADSTDVCGKIQSLPSVRTATIV